jgi:hypothetical protein
MSQGGRDSRRAIHPRQHRVCLAEPRMDGLRAEAWSYLTPNSRDVYVRLIGPSGHIVTAHLRVAR